MQLSRMLPWEKNQQRSSYRSIMTIQSWRSIPCMMGRKWQSRLQTKSLIASNTMKITFYSWWRNGTHALGNSTIQRRSISGKQRLLINWVRSWSYISLILLWIKCSWQRSTQLGISIGSNFHLNPGTHSTTIRTFWLQGLFMCLLMDSYLLSKMRQRWKET